MSSMVILGFDGLHAADEVLDKLRSMQKEYTEDRTCVANRGCQLGETGVETSCHSCFGCC
jgi:hypothetical protein